MAAGAQPPAAVTPDTQALEKAGFPPRSLIVKRIGAALRLLIDMSTNPDSPLAAIDKVGIATDGS